ICSLKLAFFLNLTPTTLTYTLSLHDALPIFLAGAREKFVTAHRRLYGHGDMDANLEQVSLRCRAIGRVRAPEVAKMTKPAKAAPDRKSTRLNSSHVKISYAVSCLKKKK